ncbi:MULTISPECIES: hypothetical protein [Streptomyces]|nr:hypothetical protein [Streptomyces venezuelae]
MRAEGQCAQQGQPEGSDGVALSTRLPTIAIDWVDAPERSTLSSNQ